MSTDNKGTEALLEAIKIIAESTVEGLQYDKTLTCTIIDNTNKADGEYVVSDGATTFKAYSAITNYLVDTVVYVTVPNGDFTKQKMIIGKKANEENSTPFVFE